jgi:hypothetical protein
MAGGWYVPASEIASFETSAQLLASSGGEPARRRLRVERLR